jgi:hypothetical protein
MANRIGERSANRVETNVPFSDSKEAAMNAVPVRSLEVAQRALQGHLIATHSQAMAASAHALLSESRECADCARLIAARDALSKSADFGQDALAG